MKEKWSKHRNSSAGSRNELWTDKASPASSQEGTCISKSDSKSSLPQEAADEVGNGCTVWLDAHEVNNSSWDGLDGCFSMSL